MRLLQGLPLIEHEQSIEDVVHLVTTSDVRALELVAADVREPVKARSRLRLWLVPS
jgi:hypothetical protein